MLDRHRVRFLKQLRNETLERGPDRTRGDMIVRRDETGDLDERAFADHVRRSAASSGIDRSGK
jgi:hypothetical protein